VCCDVCIKQCSALRLGKVLTQVTGRSGAQRDGCPKIVNLGSAKTVRALGLQGRGAAAHQAGLGRTSAFVSHPQQAHPQEPSRGTLTAQLLGSCAGPVLREEKVWLQEAVTACCLAVGGQAAGAHHLRRFV